MGSLDPEKCGGYDAHFLDELSDEYECPVCLMALREPVLTLCGHRLCFSCSEEIIKRNNGAFICPLDKTILNSEKIFPDKFTERAILQLKVKCGNFLKSCPWTGELNTVNNHLTSCEYEEVKCLNEQCSTTIWRKELSDHMGKHCIYRLVFCLYCKQKIIFCNNQIHKEKCERLPLCCANQCGMKILRKEMSSHITESCDNTIIPCQYLNIGCKFKGMRKEHETHANSSMQTHLSLAISKLDALENKITLTVDTLENKIASKVNALENKIMLTVNALENKIMSKVESLETKIASKLENKITSTVESYKNKNATEVVALENKIMSKVESLETKIFALENKITSTVESFENKNASEVVALEMKIKKKDKIMLHEKNLEVKKAFLAAETKHSFEAYLSQWNTARTFLQRHNSSSEFNSELYRIVYQNALLSYNYLGADAKRFISTPEFLQLLTKALDRQTFDSGFTDFYNYLRNYLLNLSSPSVAMYIGRCCKTRAERCEYCCVLSLVSWINVMK